MTTRQAIQPKVILVLAGLLIAAAILLAAMSLLVPIASAGRSKAPTPGTPSPFPNYTLPPMTPVPTSTALPPGIEPQKQNADQAGNASPKWKPLPSDPYHVSIDAYPGPLPKVATQHSQAVVLGVVKQVGEPQWTTPDGKRPTNPHASDNTATIYRPVLVSIQQHFKGNPTVSDVLIQATGGTVGNDKVESHGDMYTFHEGEQVILFLDRATQSVGGLPLWLVSERYNVSNGTASNEFRQQPTQQIIADIMSAQAAPGK